MTLFMALGVIFGLACLETPGLAQDAPPLVIARVTIIDGTGRAPMRDRTVLVRGDRIAGIFDSARFEPPADSRVVDARGLFLIPGLWDMHVHGANEKDC